LFRFNDDLKIVIAILIIIIFCYIIMSKNIKGKNLDININITQAGTMNADIFNAYQDFTLNGVSIVNRIATNEGDIALLNSEVITLQGEIDTNETDIATNTSDILDLQTDKQDTLTFDSTPTAGSINPVTSQGIKSYVDSSSPSITATLPLNYSGGVISGTFDSVPTNSSINFLNSNVIYDALALKQDEITSSTNLTTGNIGVVGNLTAQGQVSGASLFSSGLVSGANLEATGTITGTTLQVNNSAGNQIIALGTGNSIFSGVLCGNITSSGSISTTTGQIGTTSGSISTSSGDIITSTGDITAPSGTISAGTISATGASGTITAPIIIQGTTNLLNEINTKQDTLTFDTAPTAGSTNPVTSQGIKTYVDNSTPSITATAPINYSGGVISGTFDSVPTNSSINFLNSNVIYDALALKQDLITASTALTCDALTASSLTTTGTLNLTGGNPIVNAGVYNGVGNIISSAGDVIGDNFITNSGTNILTKINTKQDLITASTALTCGNISTTAITNNPVINSGAINCNANITTASNITCGGDLTAIGTGNNIDLRNNLVGGAGISLSQTGNNTTINNTATGTSQLYYFKVTSNRANPVQAVTTGTILDYNDIIYDVPSGNYDTTAGAVKYVVPIAGTFQFFFQAFQLEVPSDFLRIGLYQNNNLMGMGGGYVGNCERVGVILECAVGDVIQVKGVSGNEQVYMAVNYSWFEGYLLAGSSQLATSQQYYFRARGTGSQSVNSGNALNFTQITYDVPSGNYDTTNKRYVVPIAGTYQFFFQAFQTSSTTTPFRLGIYKNGSVQVQTGDKSSNTERAGVILECAVGDLIDVKGAYGTGGVELANSFGWFEGYLLQPENNTITDTTDLTTNSITTLTGNIISGGDIETSSGNFLVTNSGDVECGDLQAENLIINTNLNNETFIRTIAIAKIESNGANTKAVNCSVNRTNTGRYTFTFTSPRPTANYVINITIAENSVILDDVIVQVVNGTQTANGFNYFIHEQDNGGTAGVYRDRPSFISIFDTD
jgi:hypothetical protein